MSEKREFHRLKIKLPVSINQIADSQIETTRNEIAMKSVAPLPMDSLSMFHDLFSNDPEINKFNEKFNFLYEMLRELYERIEYLTKIVEEKPTEVIKEESYYTVDVSGNGFSFFSSPVFHLGEKIYGEILLNKFPKFGIHVIGEIIRIEKSPDPEIMLNAVKFLYINIKDQDKLINYIFQIQRFMLKSKQTDK